MLDLTASSPDITRTICDIPSESGDERALADAVAAALAPCAHLEIVRDGDAVIARTHLGRAQRVVIAGHLDTVPIADNLPTRDVSENDEALIWGRGTVDMKAGVAVQLKLAAELTEPAYDITWVWYDHEEVEATKNGLGRISRTRPELLAGDFAILGEPSNGGIEGGCNGTLRALVRTTGIRSHSARAWMGENAIHFAAPILQKLAGYTAKTVEVDGLAYREGLNAVRISGGVAGNVIPDACEVEVNFRFAPDKTADEAVSYVRRLFDEYEVEITDLSPGARPGLDAPIAQSFVAAVGGAPQPKYGWTDVARFSALGIPAVNYGPGDGQLAHHDEERVRISEIEDVERGLRGWLTGA
ncbi:succinyl-diaminopimelate desuccinylase [Microbacterium karelineae]|uniref:succinyl-diaminopimelate desuccinylase n=1 Tax=Microbacterium karelineae TaxID=2654283 RepID=UPI0012EA9281|nr:succinyl-diaminopimelate desuccinylase [Microbacterium karelineae]